MKKVEFKLSMPSNNSWNGKWTGEKNNYVIYKNLTEKYAKSLKLTEQPEQSFRYDFGDGWCACVNMRVMKEGERKQKSDGFCGYEWMVNNIVWYGDIKGKKE
jgi:hypothetical protein